MKKYKTFRDAQFSLRDWNNYTIIEKKGGFYIIPKREVTSPLRAHNMGASMEGDDIVYELFVFRGKAIRQYPNGHLGMGDEWDNSFINR